MAENKIIDTFSKDYNINYTILKYIFETKNPNINKLYLQLNYEPKKLVIKYYDGNIIEREENINFSEDDINEINKKTNKKIKIFI